MLNLDITDRFGFPVNAQDLGLQFTREDHPEYGRYGRGAGSPRYSMLIPPAPFRFTVQAKGYRSWRSELLTPKSGEVVALTVRLDRN